MHLHLSEPFPAFSCRVLASPTMKKFSNKHVLPKIPSFLIPFYLSFILHHLTIPIASDSATPYSTTSANIALDCGSSASTQAQDGRNWIGDVNPNFFHLDQQNNKASVSSVANQQPIYGDNIPYFTARLSRSEFTYTFPVTAGQKFIRLHFYSASYLDFDRSDALFSVKAGGFTLLKNFSASLTADALGQQLIDKEFCVNVAEDQSLNITFTPTPTPTHENAYAFISGIQIVSMPTNLYYSPANSEGFIFIGYNLIRIENKTALETINRINVGGSSIDPNQDSGGLLRKWSQDDDYLTEAGSSVVPVNTTIKLSYTRIPAYTAPAEVYTTARSMGMNATINKRYNLTWQFPVDSGFIYLVRLHFCEFEPEVTEDSDREFHIFIANQTAEPQADVITWSGGNGIPIYKDYAVMMETRGNQRKQNISVALHPNSDTRTRYSDAILNGVELFKLSDSNGNLAGPNPDPPQTPPPTAPPGRQSATRKNSHTPTILAIAGGLLSGIVVLSLLVFLIYRRGMRVGDSGSEGSWWGPFSYTAARKCKSSMASGNSSLPSDLSRQFSLVEIKRATTNFDGRCIIGVGGFGNVYKGYIYIDGGVTPVAIKRLNPSSRQGAHEFKTEIEMLSQLRHLHLVSLIGYCNDDGEMILVYDYMAHGTLRDHLYKTENPPLLWKKRLEICIGAARGLHYLHTGANHVIIHRDVKTTNILLDEKWVAKVSDFGLSKVGPTSTSKAHVSTVVKGSMGYLDPEYYFRQQLTEKSDVYSFGVVLFEALCARAAVNQSLPKEQVCLAEWGRSCYHEGTLDQIVDPNLNGVIAPECLKKFGEIAVSCLLDEGIKRPSMSDVVWGLEFALQLQETAEQHIKLGGSNKEIDEEIPLVCGVDDGDDDEFSASIGHVSNSTSSGVTVKSSGGTSFVSYDSDRVVSGAVFSEILNPKGR